nr:putative ribonuclease H-like domain-containing protein [Tanacetum cinerariifolium]
MAQTTQRNNAQRGTHKQYAQRTLLNPHRHVVPVAILTQSKLVPITTVRPVTTVVPKTSVTRPRQAKTVVTKTNSPPRRLINRCSVKIGMKTKMPNFRPCFLQHKCINDPKKGNPQHALKDKGVIDSGCSRHMTGNMSYLSDFKELNGGYVAFGGNPKGGKISGKEKAGEASDQKYVLFPVWSSGSTNPQNTDGDATFDEKEHEFDKKKFEYEVNVSPSSSAQSKKHDDKTMREAKGKSLVESLTGYKNLSAEFEDFSDNSINEVNVAGTLVPDVGQLSPNNTNTFSAAGPSNAAASRTHGKSSFGPIPTTRVHKDHPVTQIIGDLSLATQTRSMTRVAKDQGELSQINKDDFKTCMFACFLLQEEPKREEGIDYEEVFALVARIEAIRLFLAYASFIGFMVYQMDVKSAFLYGTIKEEVYVCQPPEFKDPDYPDKKKDGIFLSQDKYVADILRKFGLVDGKSASTSIDTEKPLLKDPAGEDVDVHTYRSVIGSLMYLTLSRPNIMFAVCACAHFQVTPKASHLHVIKKIFRYLKGKPHLGLWYPKDSPFDLVAYSDSDYAGASLDRKSTTGGCQFLRYRLISWQCKKQIVVATLSTEAEYVATASCCIQVLWIQNQLPDYGYNFMPTIIYIDNSSTICIIKNPVLHSETKHIEIRHHFIRDCNDKKLIQVLKIPSDNNFADLLTKAFDVRRFQYLVASI